MGSLDTRSADSTAAGVIEDHRELAVAMQDIERAHEHAENKLLNEAFNRDMGVAD